MKRLMILSIGTFLVLTPMIISGVSASPVYYSVSGHYYEAINEHGVTWKEANLAAQSSSYSGVKGHLATITSQGENDFIVTQLGRTVDGYWLGGIQPDESPEPAGGWQWVTGESWGYTNWNSGEPSNSYGGDQGIHPRRWPENALQITWWHTGGKWNDVPDDIPMYGYVVEYDTNQPIPPELPTTEVSANPEQVTISADITPSVGGSTPWTFNFIELGHQEKSLSMGTMVLKLVKTDYFLTESGFFKSKCRMQQISDNNNVVSDDLVPASVCELYLSGQGQLTGGNFPWNSGWYKIEHPSQHDILHPGQPIGLPIR